MPSYEWEINNPNMKKDFEKAHSGQEHNKDNEQDKTGKDIATKMELEKLESERETAHLEYNAPTPPGGDTSTTAYQNAIAKREERIRYIRQRMGLAQEQMRDDFGKAVEKAKEKQQGTDRER